jgi:uroporphyrinogen-III synthase
MLEAPQRRNSREAEKSRGVSRNTSRKMPHPMPRKIRNLKILVTRAQQQAEELSSRLRAVGAEVSEAALIEIRPPASWKPLDAALRAVASYDWLILTSANGAQALFSRMERLRIPDGELRRLRIACIGPATAKAVERRGLQVEVVPSEYVAEAVVAALSERVRGKRVLLVRAAVARKVIPRELERAGAEVNTVAAYRTTIPRAAGEKLRKIFKNPKQRPQVISFASSSTARNFVRLLGKDCHSGVLDGIAIASVGPITSGTLRELGLPATIEARDYTMAGLTKAIVRWAGKRSVGKRKCKGRRPKR